MHISCEVQGGGGIPFANMGNFMENIKKAQAMEQVEAAKLQEELARWVTIFLLHFRLQLSDLPAFP